VGKVAYAVAVSSAPQANKTILNQSLATI